MLAASASARAVHPVPSETFGRSARDGAAAQSLRRNLASPAAQGSDMGDAPPAAPEPVSAAAAASHRMSAEMTDGCCSESPTALQDVGVVSAALAAHALSDEAYLPSDPAAAEVCMSAAAACAVDAVRVIPAAAATTAVTSDDALEVIVRGDLRLPAGAEVAAVMDFSAAIVAAQEEDDRHEPSLFGAWSPGLISSFAMLALIVYCRPLSDMMLRLRKQMQIMSSTTMTVRVNCAVAANSTP